MEGLNGGLNFRISDPLCIIESNYHEKGNSLPCVGEIRKSNGPQHNTITQHVQQGNRMSQSFSFLWELALGDSDEEAMFSTWGIKLSFRPLFGSLTNWRYRRFDLTTFKLRYFAEGGECKGTIARNTIKVAEPINMNDLPHCRGPLPKRFPYPIRVWVKQIPLYVSFDNRADRDKWLRFLNHRRVVSHSEADETSCYPSAVPKLLEMNLDPDSGLFPNGGMQRSKKERIRDSYSISSIVCDLTSDEEEEHSDPAERLNVSVEERAGPPLGFNDMMKYDISLLMRPLQEYAQYDQVTTPCRDFAGMRHSRPSSPVLLARDQWNERYQQAFEDVFAVQSLDELYKPDRASSLGAQTSLSKLEAIEIEFQQAAGQLFASWVQDESKRHTTLRSFERDGVQFVLPASLEEADIACFLNTTRKRQIVTNRCREEISRLFYEYGQAEGEKATHRACSEKRISELEAKLFNLQEDPLGSFRDEQKDLKKQIRSLKESSLRGDSSMLPLYFPLECSLEFLGIPALATASILWRPSDNAHHSEQEGVNAFLTSVFFPSCSHNSENFCRLGVDGRLYFDNSVLFMSSTARGQPLIYSSYHFAVSSLLHCGQDHSCAAKFTPERLCRVFCDYVLPASREWTGSSLLHALTVHSIGLEHLGLLYQAAHPEHKLLLLRESVAQVLVTILKKSFRSLEEEDCELWWKDLGHSLYSGAWVTDAAMLENLDKMGVRPIPSSAFESISSSWLVSRIRTLSGAQSTRRGEAILPLIHTEHSPPYTLIQMIPPRRYYHNTHLMSFQDHLTLLQRSVHLSREERSTNCPLMTERCTALWSIAQELLHSCTSPGLIFCTLLHCRSALDELLLTRPCSVIGHIYRGSVEAELTSFVLEYPQFHRELESNNTCAMYSPKESMIQALRYFQNAAVLHSLRRQNADLVCPWFQFIEEEEAHELLLTQWNYYLSEVKNYHLSIPADIHKLVDDLNEFQLSCWQLYLSGLNPFRYFSMDCRVCVDVQGFLWFLSQTVISQESTPALRQSAVLCWILLIRDPTHHACALSALVASEVQANLDSLASRRMTDELLYPLWEEEIVAILIHALQTLQQSEKVIPMSG